MKSISFVSCAALPFALCLAAAGPAFAKPAPDTDGNITAYDHAGKNVLLVVECARGSLGPEYPKCLERVRADVQSEVCKPGVGKEIAGKTHYKYRMGAIKTLLADSLKCSGGGSGDGAGSGSGDSDGDSGDGEGIRGDKGSCAAYQLDGTVIVEKRCALKSGGRTHDYVLVRPGSARPGQGAHLRRQRQGDAQVPVPLRRDQAEQEQRLLQELSAGPARRRSLAGVVLDRIHRSRPSSASLIAGPSAAGVRPGRGGRQGARRRPARCSAAGGRCACGRR